MSTAKYLQIPIESTLHPAEVLLSFRHDPNPFGLIGNWFDAGAIIGSHPLTAHASDESFAADTPSVFELLNSPPNLGATNPLPTAADNRGACGSWIGYIGYPEPSNHQRSFHPIDAANAAAGSPWWFGWYDHLLRFDAADGWFFEALETEARRNFLEKRLYELKTRLNRESVKPQPFEHTNFVAVPSPLGHQQNIEAALRHITDDYLEHLNLTMRFEASTQTSLIDAFASAVPQLNAPYAAYLAPGPSHEIASFSPEQFLSRRGRTITTKPIKGTRARVGDPVLDAATAKDLSESVKERDENRLVTSLAIAELEALCEADSVKVKKLFDLEPHPGVWHLVSEITGQLLPEIGNGDILASCFPPASITGVPKAAAMALIDNLEPQPRGAYTGAIGMVGPNNVSDWSVSIRTFESIHGRTVLGVGGGLTAASDPQAETLECLIKAQPLIKAIGGVIGPQDWPPNAT